MSHSPFILQKKETDEAILKNNTLNECHKKDIPAVGSIGVASG